MGQNVPVEIAQNPGSISMEELLEQHHAIVRLPFGVGFEANASSLLVLRLPSLLEHVQNLHEHDVRVFLAVCDSVMIIKKLVDVLEMMQW